MDKLLYDEMFRIEETHWWFAARRKIIIYLIEKMVSPKSDDLKQIDIYDLGCGCGATLKALSRKYTVYGMDASDAAIRFCRERGLDIQKGELPNNIPYEEKKFDIILMLDVLEHIDDDIKAVKKALSLLKPGGIVICTVPAYQWLWTRHDEINHHKRRYNKKNFLELFSDPEITPVICTYYNTLLFPLAFVARMFSKVLDKKDKIAISSPSNVFNIIFKKIFALERFLIPKMTFPFGLSIIGIFQRTNGINSRSMGKRGFMAEFGLKLKLIDKMTSL